MSYDLDTPEGRLAAAEALGPDGYNRAMRDHQARHAVDVVNGHRLRWVPSRFGRLCMVGATRRAFRTLAEARAFAESIEGGDDGVAL